MNKMTLHHLPAFSFPWLIRLISALSISLLLSSSILALPDDRNQRISIDADHDTHLSDQGLSIYYGTPDNPVVLIQGSLKITALELRAEMIDGELHRVSAKGEPARFQQQPEHDQAIIYGKANTVDFNNSEQFLSMEGGAEFLRDDESTTAFHIDYNFITKTYNASSADNGQTRTIIMPRAD